MTYVCIRGAVIGQMTQSHAPIFNALLCMHFIRLWTHCYAKLNKVHINKSKVYSFERDLNFQFL